MGSYKFVMASTPEAVKEMLVQKSADYAGRQQTYFFQRATLGTLKNHSTFFVTRNCLFFTCCDEFVLILIPDSEIL